MPIARLNSTIRSITAAILFGTLTIASWGQEAPAAPVPPNTPETRPLPVLNYSQPVSHFPNPIAPYTARHLAAPNLANTARIAQLMHEGKLYLSLNDAIALALMELKGFTRHDFGLRHHGGYLGHKARADNVG